MTNYNSNIELIVAIDEKNGIAKNGVIPWKNSTDLKFFRITTINNVVVMGTKTFLSLPNKKPLSDRFNYIITNDPNKYSNLYKEFNNIKFLNFNDCLEEINKITDKIIFIIGGQQIYSLFINYCSVIWLTKIKSNYDCDLFFQYDDTQFKTLPHYEDKEIKISKLVRL